MLQNTYNLFNKLFQVSPAALSPGYQIVIDNVNLRKKVRHKTSTTSNVQHNLMQAYSVLDRVNCEHLPNDRPILDDIRQLPQETWWLNDTDQSLIKEEIKVIRFVRNIYNDNLFYIKLFTNL